MLGRPGHRDLARRGGRDVAAVHDPRRARRARPMAVLQVTVDEDVPLLRPIARDDRVRAEDVEGRRRSTSRCWPTTRIPTAPSTTSSVEVEGGAARVLSDGTVRITLDDEEHLLRYTITDRDGLEASAFIHVPSLDGLAPTLISTEGIEVQQRRDGRDPARRSRARVGRQDGRHHRGREGRGRALRRREPRQGPDHARLHLRATATSGRTRSRSRSPTAPAPTTPKG